MPTVDVDRACADRPAPVVRAGARPGPRRRRRRPGPVVGRPARVDVRRGVPSPVERAHPRHRGHRARRARSGSTRRPRSRCPTCSPGRPARAAGRDRRAARCVSSPALPPRSGWPCSSAASTRLAASRRSVTRRRWPWPPPPSIPTSWRTPAWPPSDVPFALRDAGHARWRAPLLDATVPARARALPWAPRSGWRLRGQGLGASCCCRASPCCPCSAARSGGDDRGGAWRRSWPARSLAVRLGWSSAAGYLFREIGRPLGDDWRCGPEPFLRWPPLAPGLRVPVPARVPDRLRRNPRLRARANGTTVVLGRRYPQGVWYYFALLWLLKTPLLAPRRAGVGSRARARATRAPRRSLVRLLACEPRPLPRVLLARLPRAGRLPLRADGRAPRPT